MNQAFFVVWFSGFEGLLSVIWSVPHVLWLISLMIPAGNGDYCWSLNTSFPTSWFIYWSGILQAFHRFNSVRLACEWTSTLQGCQIHLRAVLHLHSKINYLTLIMHQCKKLVMTWKTKKTPSKNKVSSQSLSLPMHKRPLAIRCCSQVDLCLQGWM